MHLKKSLAALAISLLTLGIASAQDGESITFKFRIDEQAFADVETSAELVQVLRDSARIDMGITMDSQLWVDIRGYAGDPNTGGQLGHLLLPGMRVALKGRQSIEDSSWAEAIVESHGDDFPDDGDRWDEQEVDGWTADEAWLRLVEAIDQGLPGSSEGFGRLGDGEHQPLRVTGVEVRSFEHVGFFACCYPEHGIDGPTIVLKPELRWDTERFPSDGEITYRLDALILHVEPTEAPAAPPAPESEEVARMLAGRSCASLAPGGAAEVTLDGVSYEGVRSTARDPGSFSSRP